MINHNRGNQEDNNGDNVSVNLAGVEFWVKLL